MKPSEPIPLALLFLSRLKQCRYTPIVFSIHSAKGLILRRCAAAAARRPRALPPPAAALWAALRPLPSSSIAAALTAAQRSTSRACWALQHSQKQPP
eukprot:SAG25_NODE_618_length_6422_cov_3.817894_16_plen_97_part_00